MVDIIKALNPKSPTLDRVVLPKGAELVKAVGKSGSEASPAPEGTQRMPRSADLTPPSPTEPERIWL